jgi:ABC-2 type transport system permease protein
MFDHVFRFDHFLIAAVLDAVYIVLGGAIFLHAFRQARQRGALLQMGE